MKTSTRLKGPGDSSSDAVHVARATAPAIRELSLLPASESVQAGQDFREMIHRRCTTPFPVAFPEAFPYHHGGLNE